MSSSDTTLPDYSRDRDPAPARIGKYVLQAPLGSGGFGSVYKAFDEVFERAVALKLYHRPSRDSVEDWYPAFLREARALVRLDHPAVARVLDATVIDGSPVIVMGLVSGPSLRSVIPHDRP